MSSPSVPPLLPQNAALLESLAPRPLWHYFLALSEIPRPSKQEARAADWVAEQGRALGGEVERDAVGNVLIRVPATPGREARPTVALQGHVDMVCEQNEGTGHDFTRDPLKLRRDGDRLRATGTTLGADNGIGVAAALAVLADPTLERPALEVLITIDEETGLTGAANLQPGWLRAATLLNLDSEAEGEVTIGCAGGVDTLALRTLTYTDAPAGAETIALRLKIAGLRGGHSGIDIHQGRGNALRLLGAALERLRDLPGFALGAVGGGNKRNAIPREAFAVVQVAAAAEAVLRERAAAAQEAFRSALGAFDAGVTVELREVRPGEAARLMSTADADALIGLLLAGPTGVEAMSPDIPGLVQTSTNMGVLDVSGDRLSVSFLTRSAVDSSKLLLARRVEAIATRLGFTCEGTNGYPGWKPVPTSGIVRRISEIHVSHFGRPIEVKALHAGLECGLIGEKYPDMEMASIGPDMADVHTPDEYVSIPSVERFYGFLRAVLGAL